MKAKYSPTPDNKMTTTPPTKAISPKKGNREATKTNKANIPTITPKSPTRVFFEKICSNYLNASVTFLWKRRQRPILNR